MVQSEVPITHIYPLADIWGHVTEGTECPCDPTIEVVGAEILVMHNSFDHREIVEQAIAYLNGENIDDTP